MGGRVGIFNRAQWGVIREMSLAGSGLTFSPPPIPQDASLAESGIGIAPTLLIPQNVVTTEFSRTLSQYFALPWGSKNSPIA